MVYVLVPVKTARHCFLNEAVNYLAFGRLPLEDYLWGLDVREEPKEDLDIQPYEVEDCGTLTFAAKDRVGFADLKDPGRHEKLQAYLDHHWVKLFNLLHEGAVSTRGKLEMYQGGRLLSSEWQFIPSNFWASAKTDWMENTAEGRVSQYKWIQVVTDDLFRVSPLPALEPADDVARRGDNYFLERSGFANEISPTLERSRGRPSFNWDQFRVEVTKRFMHSQVPEKQEAFISEMQAWCSKHWGHEPARSTLLQQLKPYYDGIVRAKKSEK